MKARKLAEAKAELATATGSLKTSMFKWNKDWITAAGAYGNAAMLFKQGGDLDAAKEAHEQSSAAKLELGQYYGAAQALEAAAKISLDQKRGESTAEAASYYERASAVYHEGSEIDKAAKALLLGGKAAEGGGDMQRASSMFGAACDLLEDGERGILALETFRETARFMVANEQYADVLPLLERMAGIHISAGQANAMYKVRLTQTIVRLAMGDFVAAEREFNAHLQDSAGGSEYLLSAECEAEEEMVTAFKNLDQERLEAAVAKQTVGFLENAIVRLARSLKVTGGGARGKPASNPAAAAAHASASAAVVAPSVGSFSTFTAPAPAAAPPAPAPAAAQAAAAAAAADGGVADEAEDAARESLFAKRPAAAAAPPDAGEDETKAPEPAAPAVAAAEPNELEQAMEQAARAAEAGGEEGGAGAEQAPAAAPSDDLDLDELTEDLLEDAAPAPGGAAADEDLDAAIARAKEEAAKLAEKEDDEDLDFLM